MSKSAPTRPIWFIEERDGLRRQEEFFKKLHNLKENLLRTEEYNMNSALERLYSRKHKRRSSFKSTEHSGVRSGMGYQPYAAYGQRSSQTSVYPSARAVERWRRNRTDDAPETAKVKGDGLSDKRHSSSQSYKIYKAKAKTLTPEIDVKGDSSMDKRHSSKNRKTKAATSARQTTRPRCSNPKLKDDQMAQIAANLHDLDLEKSFDLVRDPSHLPSIPTVGHRVPVTYENRFRAMTSEFEFREPGRVNKQTSKSSDKTRQRQAPPPSLSNERMQEKKSEEGISFDVDPKDKDVFKHLNTNRTEIGAVSPIPPIPPVNSRMTSSPAVPKIVLPEVDAFDSENDTEDSSRDFGALNNAMQRFVCAHSDLEQLKEELTGIAKVTDELEKCEDEEGSFTKL
eukprot:Seg452.2 transcript_id=Seg452.2/GoldUCD/mRNA.D3Y31 product="hypothetical protein" protein_id=Seg452.2/GoldUCD/D3Y31